MSRTGHREAVVIGGGLGGVAAAVSLAARGMRTVLYEKNSHIGGKLNSLRTQGFSFDLGPSILTLPHVFRDLFARAGERLEERCDLVPVRPHWRNFFPDGTSFDLTPDTVSQERELAGLDDGGAGLFSFLEFARRQYRIIDEGYFRRGYDTVRELIRGYGPLRSTTGIETVSSVHEVVRQHVRDEKLQHTLDYFTKYVGSSPYDAPGLLGLLAYVQYGFDLWYVRGGLSRLAAALEGLLRSAGVEVHLGREVTAVLTRGGRATGVRLDDGTTVAADGIVCNMEVVPAYRKLLGEDRDFLSRYARFEPSCSGLVVHLGLDRVYPQLAHHNFFHSADPAGAFRQIYHEGELPDDPTVYVVAPSRTDPGAAPPGMDNLKLLPHLPHLGQGPRNRRGHYLAFREHLLAKLERMGLDGLRRHIVFEDLWTPEDIESRYYSDRGAIYGVAADRFRNAGFKLPKRSEKYEGLFFAGGSVNPGAGMPMAVLSGMQAADRLAAGPVAPKSRV